MNRKAQILARLKIIIASWAVLLFTVILMFVFQSFSESEARTPLNSVKGSTAESVLAAYLRHTVDFAGNQVPFAEALVWAAMTNNQEYIKQQTQTFLASAPPGNKQIEITLPSGESVVVGDTPPSSPVINYAGFAQGASSVLPLPDGRSITVTYGQEFEIIYVSVGQGGI